MFAKTVLACFTLLVLVEADERGVIKRNGGGGSTGSVSNGYGAPAGGNGPPATGYGPPANGGGNGGPIYTYQQQANNGGGNNGLLKMFKAGLVAGKIGVIGLGLLAFFVYSTLFPTVTVTGRKKRETNDDDFVGGNSTNTDQVSALHDLIDQFGLENASQLQKDMVATYLECSDPGQGEPSLTGCIERLACMYYDKSAIIDESEKEVASVILTSFLDNEFLTPEYKTRLQMAGQNGHSNPGTCHKFQCHHKLIHGETGNRSQK